MDFTMELWFCVLPLGPVKHATCLCEPLTRKMYSFEGKAIGTKKGGSLENSVDVPVLQL